MFFDPVQPRVTTPSTKTSVDVIGQAVQKARSMQKQLLSRLSRAKDIQKRQNKQQSVIQAERGNVCDR